MTGSATRRGGSLRSYMALFMAVLIAVAVGAGLAVRGMAEQDAQQSAAADSNFAAQKAAKLLASGFDQIQAVTGPLTKDPNLTKIYANPSLCGLGYAPLGAFSTGRIDLVRLDGSIVCTSSKSAGAGTSPMYAGQTWLSSGAPVVVAPVLDPETGNQVVIISYPVPGKGAVVWFLDLAPIGPNLEGQFGSGVHNLEFLIPSADGRTVVVRSIAPAEWIGRSSGSSFTNAAKPAIRPDLNGTQRIYRQATVNSAGWHLYVGADEAAAMAEADRLANRGLGIILAGVAIMLVVSFIVYRRIAEPVRRLSLVMRGATPGEAVKAVASTAGATEVIGLAEDFDKLMGTVRRELAERLDDEQAALVSERNYRTLFEGHPQPMWLYDVDTLAFLNVNDAALDRYGYSRDEFLAMTIKDIRPPQDVPKLLELVEGAQPGFDKSGPWRHQLRDGTTFQVLVTSHAVIFDGHSARFVLAEDLSESHRLELELQQSKARAESSAELSRAK